MSSPRSDAQDPGAAPGGDLDALAEAAGVERIPADRVDPDRGGRLGQGAPGREVAADAPDSEAAYEVGDPDEPVPPRGSPAHSGGDTAGSDAATRRGAEPYDIEAHEAADARATGAGTTGASAADATGAGDDTAGVTPPGETEGQRAGSRLAPRSYVVDGRDIDMSVDLGHDIILPNPLMTASGCAANGRELHRFFDISELGAFVTKTVMAKPRSGRGTPRMAETPSGMLNSIGLQGPGIEAFVAEDLPWLKSVGARVLVSIAGTEPREFADVTRVLRNSEAFDTVVGVEVNISCPNVANRGLVFACDSVSTTHVLQEVRTELPPDIPAFAKLSPDVTDIVQIARAALQAGASGLTMINTLLGMQIDTDALAPTLAGVTGGLSGPAIHPVAVRAVYQVHASMRSGRIPMAPIIGVGGVRTGLDALQLIAAGACAVQVGTATFHDPQAPARVLRELTSAVAQRGFVRLNHVVGIAHTRH